MKGIIGIGIKAGLLLLDARGASTRNPSLIGGKLEEARAVTAPNSIRTIILTTRLCDWRGVTIILDTTESRMIWPSSE
jgi:hypothetical protein